MQWNTLIITLNAWLSLRLSPIPRPSQPLRSPFC